jgi:hypothetical protein
VWGIFGLFQENIFFDTFTVKVAGRDVIRWFIMTSISQSVYPTSPHATFHVCEKSTIYFFSNENADYISSQNDPNITKSCLGLKQFEDNISVFRVLTNEIAPWNWGGTGDFLFEWVILLFWNEDFSFRTWHGKLPCNPIRNLLYFSNFRQAETWRRFRGNANQKHNKIGIYVQVENIRYLCIKSVNIFMLCK